MASKTLRIALVGAGMFGGDVHARVYADLARAGISPWLGRIGLDHLGRDLSEIHFVLSAIATRSERSAAAVAKAFEAATGQRPKVYFGDTPWEDVLRQEQDIDLVSVATPDHLHTPVICSALKAKAHVITEKPMCLDVQEADRILELAAEANRIVAVDMHKRYDPDHLRIRNEIRTRIGDPL